MKSNIKKERERCFTKKKIFTFNQKIDSQTKKAIGDASQAGASPWLSAISLEQYGFFLNKAEFRDAIMLRYGKDLIRVYLLHVLLARSAILHML